MADGVEAFETNLGVYDQEYAQAAKKVGLPKEGVFILSTYADMLKNGSIEPSEIVTPREMLFRLADDVEENGIKGNEREAFANKLRYLANFIVERPVPGFDEEDS